MNKFYKIRNNDVCLFTLGEKDKLPESISDLMLKKTFLLLFINLSSLKNIVIKNTLEDIVNDNLKLFSAWGNNSAEIEDLVDIIDLSRQFENPSKKDLYVVTTSHAEESLEDVLDVFLNSWETLNCSNRLILIYGQDNGSTLETVVGLLEEQQ